MPASWHGRRTRRGARFKGVIHTESRLKPVLYTTILIVLLFLLAGFATFLFSETEGQVISSSTSEVRNAGHIGLSGSYRNVDSDVMKTSLNVEYKYLVGEESFNNSVVAYWFTNNPKETFWKGKKLRVFYFPFYPKISVLKQGPDILLLVAVILSLIGWLFIKSYIKESL